MIHITTTFVTSRNQFVLFLQACSSCITRLFSLQIINSFCWLSRQMPHQHFDLTVIVTLAQNVQSDLWFTPGFNPLPNDKIFDWSKLKAFADDKINVTENLKYVLKRVENIVGKRRNYWWPAFSPFPTMFSEAFPFRVIKSGDFVVKGQSLTRVGFNCKKNLILDLLE